MTLLILQIVATLVSFCGGMLLVYKRRLGWLVGFVALILLMIINYSAGLYILMIPCMSYSVVNILGYINWKKTREQEAWYWKKLYLREVKRI